jgi:hypothetical protein
MLTVFTSTYCRPDYVQLLACALKRTLDTQYRFVVVVQPGGLRRPWDGVDEVVDGTTANYQAWRDIIPMVTGPSVILHDDCVPVLPWSAKLFPGAHVIRFAGQTLQYHATEYEKPLPVLQAARIRKRTECPSLWPSYLCEAAAAAKVESMLDGTFLHIDKGTIAHPSDSANAAKPALIEAIAKHLGCDVPEPLTAQELAAHPAPQMRRQPRGLGDMVSAGLSAIGITPERVSKALGVKDCGCRQRAEALNRIGRRLGIG